MFYYGVNYMGDNKSIATNLSVEDKNIISEQFTENLPVTNFIDIAAGEDIDSDIDASVNDIYHQYSQAGKIFFLDDSDSESEPSKLLDNWRDPGEGIKIVTSQASIEKERISPSVYQHHIIIQLEDSPVISDVIANLISKHPDNTILIQADLKNKNYRSIYGDINSHLIGNIRWTIVGNGHYFSDGQVTTFAKNTPQELVDGLVSLKGKLDILKVNPDKIVLLGCQLAKGSGSNNFALNTVENFHHVGLDMPIVAYSGLVYVDKEGKKLIAQNHDADKLYSTKNFKHTYQVDNYTKTPLINGLPAIIYLMRNFPEISNQFGNFIIQNQKYLQPYFTQQDNTLDFNLIKKSIFSFVGAKVFVETITSFNDDFSNFHQILTNAMIARNVIDTPIWKHISYPTIESWAENRKVTGKEELHIIIRLNDKKNSRDHVFNLAAENIKNTVIIQLDIDTNEMHIEYGELENLSHRVEQRWTIIDTLDGRKSNEIGYLDILSENIEALCKKYKLNIDSPIELIGVPEPVIMPAPSQNKMIQSSGLPLVPGNNGLPGTQPASRPTVIHHGSEITRRQIIRADPLIDDILQQHAQIVRPSVIRTASESTRSLNHWWDTTKIVGLLPPRLGRESNLIFSYKQNIIIQLDGDEIINDSAAKILQKRYHNSTLVQFNIKTKEYRVIYGQINPSEESTRWIVVGNSNYLGDNKMTRFADNMPNEFVDGLVYLKSKLNIEKNPSKIVLVGNQLAKGSANENFALNAVNYFYLKNFDTQLVAYPNLIGTDEYGHRIIVDKPSEQSFNTNSNYKNIYTIDENTKLPLINGKPAIFELIYNYHNISTNLESLIKENYGYFKIYFTQPSGELDLNLIKKTIFSFTGANVFIRLVKSFKHHDHSGFYQALTQKMIEHGVLDVPIWNEITYSPLIRNKNKSSVTSNESLHIILRLSNNYNVCKKTFELTENNFKNSIVIQLDINRNNLYVEYGNESDLTQFAHQHWTVIDDIHHSNKTPKEYFAIVTEKINTIANTYSFKKPNQIDVFHLFEPINSTGNTASISQQLQPYGAGTGYFSYPLDYKLDSTSHDDSAEQSNMNPPSEIEKTISENGQQYLLAIQHEPMELDSLRPKPLAEWMQITDLPEYMPKKSAIYDDGFNIIIQLEDDLKAHQAIKGLVSKHPDNTVVLQYSIDESKYRTVYGNLDNIKDSKVRWLTIGNGEYTPWKILDSHKRTITQTCLSTYAELSPEQFAKALLGLKLALNINQSPEKLVLLGCDLAKGRLKDNFAFNITKLLGQLGMILPIVAYRSKVGVDVAGHKIFTSDPQFPPSRVKEYRQVYQYIAEKIPRITINDKPLILNVINQYSSINQPFTQFVADYRVYLAPYFSKEDKKLDLDLIKQVVLDQSSNQLFGDLISEQGNRPLDSAKFYQSLVAKMAENNSGFSKGPMWKKVDYKYIYDLSLITDRTKSNDLDIVFRFKDSELNREQSAYIAARNPKNTIIIQFDPESQKSYIEYGDINLIKPSKNQNWTILASIGRGLLDNAFYQKMLSNRLQYLQVNYNLSSPREIKIIDLNKDIRKYSAIKYSNFTSSLTLALSKAGINTNILMQDQIVRAKIPLESFYFDTENKFTYDIESKAAYIKNQHYVMYILGVLSISTVDISKTNLIKYPFFSNYFTNSEGEFNYDKLQLVINDPIISRQVNNYFVQEKFLQQDSTKIWDEIFKLPEKRSIKQKIVDLCYLLEQLQNVPQKIRKLGSYSLQLLNELDPSNKSTVLAKVMTLIHQPEKMIFFQQQLSAILGLDLWDSFEHLSLGEILQKQIEKYNNYLNSSGDILKISRSADVSVDLSSMTHSFPLLYDNTMDKNIYRVLGRLYAYSQLENSATSGQQNLSDILSYIATLNSKKEVMPLSIEENKFLNYYYLLSSELMEQQKSGILSKNDKQLVNQPLTQWLAKLEAGNYQIETKTGILTFVVKNGTENYQYSLYDSNGWAITYSNSNKNKVQETFLKDVAAYLNSPISDIGQPIVTRAEQYGMRKDSNLGDYLVDVNILADSYKLQTFLTRWFKKLSIPKIDSSGMLQIDKVTIPLETLNRIGATIDGSPLNRINTSKPEALKSIHFDTKKLMFRLAHMDGNTSDIKLINALKQIMLNYTDVRKMITADADIAEYSILLKQLDYIKRYTDSNNQKIKFKLWEKLQTAGVKLPRYAKAMNVAGQGMALFGLMTLLTSTYNMLEQLDNPLLSPAERKEIHKNLGVAWSSGVFELADFAQPWLLKIAYKQAKSFNAASSYVGKFSIGLSALGTGIELGSTALTFIELLNEKDPERRQDLMVNYYLSLTGAGVGLYSLIGIIFSMAAAGPAGLVAGGILLLGGLAYNSYRKVSAMKKDIQFDSIFDEIEEGVRAAIGLGVTTKTENKLREAHTKKTISENSWLNDIHFYSQFIQPAGFDSHLYVDEELQMEERPLYRLISKARYNSIDKKTMPDPSHFALLKDVIPCYLNDKNGFTTESNAALFTDDEVNVLNKLDEYISIESEKKYYVPITKQSSNEIFIFDNKYENHLLEFHFNAKAEIESGKKLHTNSLRNLRFYSLNKTGVYKRNNNQLLLKENFSDINDRDLINEYLQRREGVSGLSINTGSGNDVVIGAPDERYSFKVSNGNKLLVGGNKNDYFYYMANDKSIAKNNDFFNGKLNIAPVIKYLDAREGIDTLVVTRRVEKYRTKISLKDKEISYLSQNNSYSAAVIDNFENIIGHAQQGEILEGNDKDNYLDGAGGKDKIYGLAGNDHIMLNQGYANGGIGDDYYVIKRYLWSQQTKNLYINEKKYSEEHGRMVDKQVLNKKYRFNRGYGVNSKIEIDESSLTASSVELEYNLKEISEVKLVGNDLHIYIDIAPHQLDKNNWSSDLLKKSKKYLILKNVYRDSQDKKAKLIQHKYNIKTQDGFLLTSKLGNISTQDEIPKNIFNIQYVQSFDKLINNEIKLNVDIDTSSKRMIIDLVNHGEYGSPDWGDFIWLGTSGKLTFTGDKENNVLLSINVNSKIYASQGIDYYQFSNFQQSDSHDAKSQIVFDFSKLASEDENNDFTDQDKMFLLLEHHLGDDLIMQNNSLYFKNELNNKVSINFVNFKSDVTNVIYIKDKENKLFSVELNKYGGSIEPIVYTIISTASDDDIVISSAYPQQQWMDEGKEGDDNIIDFSGKGRFIKGDEGNDILIGTKGENVLYGGLGDDRVYGGIENDLLISNYGKDQLLGCRGDDIYLIDGETIDDVSIEDTEGSNNIYLMNFSMKPREKKQADNRIDHIYRAKNGKTLTIRNINQEDKNIISVHDASAVKVKLANYFNVESNLVTERLIQNMASEKIAHQKSISSQDNKPSSIWSPIGYLTNLMGIPAL